LVTTQNDSVHIPESTEIWPKWNSNYKRRFITTRNDSVHITETTEIRAKWNNNGKIDIKIDIECRECPECREIRAKWKNN
jgi:hypothetical protein